MVDYLYRSCDDEYRDISSEIDAGELDEQFLIKYANDYAGGLVLRPLGTLKTRFVDLLNIAIRFSRLKPNDESTKPVPRPVATGKIF